MQNTSLSDFLCLTVCNLIACSSTCQVKNYFIVKLEQIKTICLCFQLVVLSISKILQASEKG